MVDPRIKIDKLRIEHNMSLSQLAKAIDISETSVYNWYNEKNSMPTIHVLERVCLLFHIDMTELFTDIEYDKLTAKQIKLLELFSQLTEIQQENVISIIGSIIASNKTE